jgi:hypothetical protein
VQRRIIPLRSMESTVGEMGAEGAWPVDGLASPNVEARLRRRGTARLLGFFLLALLTLLATDRAINAGLRRIRTSTFGVMNGIVDGRINAQILVTGSSRALVHFDPRLIQAATGARAFNIGINGSQIDMQVAVFKTYLKHNVTPFLLVHSLDLYSFVTSRNGVFWPGQYVPFLKEEDIYQALRAVDRDTWKARHVPLYGYAVGDLRFTWWTGMRALFGWSPREDRYLGFQPRAMGWTGDFDRLRLANPDGVRFDVEPEGVRNLDEMLALCQRRGVRVLLVYSPEYYEMQALEKNRDAVFALFRDVAARQGAAFWDYSSSPICYRKEYFYNSQHLNAAGAAAFSRDLAAALAASPLSAHR